jgi:DHA1 family multidrug resistance protein-like MFS transporter
MRSSLYTFSVYVGSAIYVPSEPGVMEEFGVGQTVASLGLALYVLGCMSSLQPLF